MKTTIRAIAVCLIALFTQCVFAVGSPLFQPANEADLKPADKAELVKRRDEPGTHGITVITVTRAALNSNQIAIQLPTGTVDYTRASEGSFTGDNKVVHWRGLSATGGTAVLLSAPNSTQVIGEIREGAGVYTLSLLNSSHQLLTAIDTAFQLRGMQHSIENGDTDKSKQSGARK